MSPSRCQKRGGRSIMQGSIFLIVPPPLLFLLSSWLYFGIKKRGQMRCSKSKTSSKSLLPLRPDSRLAFHLHSVLDFSRWLHRIMDDREGGREGGRLQAGRSPSMMGHPARAGGRAASRYFRRRDFYAQAASAVGHSGFTFCPDLASCHRRREQRNALRK